jgi:glycosyltransferase involved in cell wall biosynthesis
MDFYEMDFYEMDFYEMNAKGLSLVVPVFDEAENLWPYARESAAVFQSQVLDYEIILVDDGSTDGSLEELRALNERDRRIVITRFRRIPEQTAGFAAGSDHARGKLILTIDGDRQNDPADIPGILAKIEERYDVVNDWRQIRKDSMSLHKLPSLTTNRMIACMTGVPLHVRGCSLRLFRAGVARNLRLHSELHRFVPEMVSFGGFSMAKVPVSHRPHVSGHSSYGLSRTFRVLLDLIIVLFLRKCSDRPMQLFGRVGIALAESGTVLGLYLTGFKAWAGVPGGWEGFHNMEIGERPLLLLSAPLNILGVQYLLMGLIDEWLFAFTMRRRDKTVYHINEIIRNVC